MPWQSNVALRCLNGLALNLPAGVGIIAFHNFLALCLPAEVFPPFCLGAEACPAQGKRSFTAPAFLTDISRLPLSKCCRDSGKSWKSMDYGNLFF